MRFNMVSDSMVFVMDSGIVTKSVVLAVPESMTKAGHIQTGLN